MRALTAGAVASGLVGLGLLVVLTGRTIVPNAGSLSVATGTKGEMPGPSGLAKSQPPETDLYTSSQAARGVGQDVVAPPSTESETLVREAPRDPLSSLGQALPPPEPEITLFYRPVATASASFEAMGYKLAIAGTESVDPDETCTSGSIDWPCGVRARAAVRMWVRGRALNCAPPPKDKDRLATVTCNLGKQDVGAWLVSNGWARAVPGGPYAEAEAKAREGKIGIFGQPPKALPPDTTRSELPPLEDVLPSDVLPSGDLAAPDVVN